MTKIFVTETYERVYTLEVNALDYTTISKALDEAKSTMDVAPSWVFTNVIDEVGDGVLDW